MGFFPTMTKELLDENRGWLQPKFLDAQDRLMLCIQSYIVKTPHHTIMIDSCVGNHKPRPTRPFWNMMSSDRYEKGFAATGLGVADIDFVMCTHLHVDHVGWNTDRNGDLVFPTARYVAHGDGIAFARATDRPHVARTIAAVDFEEIGGETELAAGVTAFELPGHFPGHMGLRIASGGSEAVLIADAAVHPMLLHEPDAVYVSDGDPAACAATRRALLTELVDRDVLTVCGHYQAGGIGRVVTRDERIVWEPA
jgi:glyoxylase-like metal-dependent hydrolase (beta-lactamase superfamily II)